ncbi:MULTISPECIES: hypothetical protein [unclassified Bradyrhizobium]|uniref:hypothetical protein n=1 Tax=unclassified Bradyrhizobium TaxID=2631580 RepID=UPI0027D55260|nr:hypothetical protein TM233_61490 [Bradyrhizobium sp. TM233]GMO93744.1 hypothetical protein TM239_03520 [Bradyrhizobium sp. TM239]
MTDSTAALSADEFASLAEVGKGKAQDEIPQGRGERLVNLGYAIRRLGKLELTSSGVRRLATGE